MRWVFKGEKSYQTAAGEDNKMNEESLPSKYASPASHIYTENQI